MGRLLLRRRKRVATLVGGKQVTEPQLIDVDMLACHCEMLFGGLMAQGVDENEYGMAILRQTDGVLLFALLALLRTNDYSDALPGCTLINIMRAVREHPDLARSVMRVLPHARFTALTQDPVVYLNQPRQVQLYGDSFLKLVHACYDQVWLKRPGKINKDGQPSMRADQSPNQAPLPDKSELMGKCARVAWTLDKMLNGGRRGYICANELETGDGDLQGGTPPCVHGYREVGIEREDGSWGRIVAEDNHVQRAHDSYYGVRQRDV
jgi:hypothetical protein